MSERPIIMNAPMVKALLPGRKTMTRRFLKPQPPCGDHFGRDIMDWDLSGIYQDETNSGPSKWWLDVQTDVDDNSHREIDVRFAVGDRLWVRETCRAEELPDGHDGVRYIADDAWSPIENTQQASDAWVALNHYRHSVNGKRGQTVPPIHMPRWASRITLTVKEVKVERLQDIGEEDAEAEGARYFPDIPLDPLHRRFPSQADRWSMEDPKTTGDCLGDARFAFANFWLKLHGQGAASWDANPWVTAVRFTADVSRAVRGGGVTP